MKFDRWIGICLAGSILAISGTGNVSAAGETLHTGDSATMGKWYGRAGGLVGADRISFIASPGNGSPIGITYDKDVAQRTNMPARDTGTSDVGISYDKDVAARTNMPRGEKEQQQTTSVGATEKAAN